MGSMRKKVKPPVILRDQPLSDYLRELKELTDELKNCKEELAKLPPLKIVISSGKPIKVSTKIDRQKIKRRIKFLEYEISLYNTEGLEKWIQEDNKHIPSYETLMEFKKHNDFLFKKHKLRFLVKNDSNIMTAKEVADYLKVSLSTVYKIATKGIITNVSFYGDKRFNRDEINELIRKKEEENKRNET